MDYMWCIVAISVLIPAYQGLQLHVIKEKKTIGCGLPELSEGVLYESNHDGNRLFYRCERGYSTVGSVFSVCESGQWSSPPPICIASGCRKIYYVEHGHVVLGYGGAMVTVTCKEGFTMTGSKVLVCDGSQWNATLPICSDGDDRGGGISYSHSKPQLKTHSDWLLDADYSCIKTTATVRPPAIQHALGTTQWAVLQGQPRLYTLYRCMWGYVSKGEANKLYCKNGEWMGALPKCVQAVTTAVPEIPRDQAGPDQTSHVDWLRLSDFTCMGTAKIPELIKPEPVNNGHYALRHEVVDGIPRLYAELRCDLGYKLQDEQNNVYCKLRSWFGPQPKCIQDKLGRSDVKASCHEQNGGCEHECNTEDGRVACSCNPGYQLANDHHSCFDKDECDVENGGCEHICRNSLGSYSCHCYAGHQLSADRHSCKPSSSSKSDEMKAPMALFHH